MRIKEMLLRFKESYIIIFASFGLVLAFVLLSAFFASSNISVYADSSFSGGTGGVLDPYQISTGDDLRTLAVDVNTGVGGVNGYYNKYFVLTANLDISDLCTTITNGWEPIGSGISDRPFKGVIDGQGFSIVGLNISRSSNYQGLFGALTSTATVKNLTVVGTVSGASYVGGVAGYNIGEIENCTSNVSVAGTSQHIGGIVGYNDVENDYIGDIVSCFNNGTITAGNAILVGGIAGSNLGNITESANYGTINGYSSVGGIAGYNAGRALIDSVYNVGAVNADNTAGGIVGHNNIDSSVMGIISNVYNIGAINVSNNIAGGIAGGNSGKIINAYSASNISGTNRGGIAGSNTGEIRTAYSSSDKFTGNIINGAGLEENCNILSDRLMVASDTLTNEDKMSDIANESGTDKWVKRAYDTEFCYYPELAVFKNSNVALVSENSKSSARVARIVIDANNIILDNVEFTYNGYVNEPNISYLNTALVKGADFDYTSTCTGNINAGLEDAAEMSITFHNYYKGNPVKNFTILKKEISVEWTTETFIYNGNFQGHTVASYSGNIYGEEIEFLYEHDTNIVVGEHSITVKLSDTLVNSNYQLNNTAKDHIYSIGYASITLVWGVADFTYDGNIHYPIVSGVEGKIGEENITFTYAGDTESKNASDISTYSVTAVLDTSNATNSNYIITGSASKDFNISKRTISVSWDMQELTYNSQIQYPQINEITNAVHNEELIFVYTGDVDKKNATDANVYSVTANLKDNATNGNYEFSESTCWFKIAKKELSIIWSDVKLEYNGSAQHPLITSLSGTVNSEKVTFQYIDYNNNINASQEDEYGVTLSFTTDDVNANYKLPSNATKYYMINKKAITINWDAQVLYYNGIAQHPIATVATGCVNGEDITFVYSNYTSNINANVVNGYQVNIELDSENETNNNYLFAGEQHLYSINPNEITIEWNTDAIYYTGDPQHPLATVKTGKISNDAITFTYSGYSNNIKASDSKYYVTANLANTEINKNYVLSDDAYQYCIEKRPLTVVWSAEEFYYNGEVQHHTLTVTEGIQKSEVIIFRYIYESNIHAGEHAVKGVLQDNAVNANYVMVEQIDYYVIYKSEIAILWSDDVFCYNGKPQHPTVTVISGRINEEEITFDYYNYMNNVVAKTDYNVDVKLSDSQINTNYKFTGETKKYSINKKPITIEWAETILYYNGSAQRPAVKNVNGVLDGENATFEFGSYSGNINASTNNQYSVEIFLLDTVANSNYSFVSQTKKYDISKKSISVSADNVDLYYNGLPQHPFVFVSDGLVDNSTLEFVYTDYSENINASFSDDYSVSVHLTDATANANYMYDGGSFQYQIKKRHIYVEWNATHLYYNGQPQHPIVSTINGKLDNELVTFIYAGFEENIIASEDSKYSVSLH
ncbi:MAG: hypothetical protein LBE09_09130, partial [Christensenellaceae bacterium]|nr:hypothetical protein [Christensenellaceae bacterium]